MLLKDATSREQVQEALDAGDEELRENIEQILSEAKFYWERHDNNPDYDVDTFSLSDVVRHNEKFLDEVISQSPSEWDLAPVPRDVVKGELESLRDYRGAVGPFSAEERRKRWETVGFSFSAPTELSYHFDTYNLYNNKGLEYIPEDMAEDFFSDLGHGITWHETDRIHETWGNGEGESVEITAGASEFAEFCRDVLATYVQRQIKKDPEKAKEVFYKGIGEHLGAQVRAAALPEEDLLDLVTRFFEGENEREEVLDEIREYLATIKGSNEPREVLVTITRDDLRALGITKGTFWEEAPWTLIKLHPSDLRMEGTRMNHCVGQKDMGYIRAVKDGEVQIWSLRSRADKPRFTLEVDPKFDSAEEESVSTTSGPMTYFTAERERGRAISQLKGKGNRTPGYADNKRNEIKFPDEVLLWDWLLRDKLKADPEFVEDFWDPTIESFLSGQRQERQVAENRRSSRRRSSRRSSKRRSSRRSSRRRQPFLRPNRSFDEPFVPRDTSVESS